MVPEPEFPVTEEESYFSDEYDYSTDNEHSHSIASDTRAKSRSSYEAGRDLDASNAIIPSRAQVPLRYHTARRALIGGYLIYDWVARSWLNISSTSNEGTVFKVESEYPQEYHDDDNVPFEEAIVEPCMIDMITHHPWDGEGK